MRFTSRKLAIFLLSAALPVLSSCGEGEKLVINGPLLKANKLNKQVKELICSRRYTKALPLARKALAYREKSLKPDHAQVLESQDALATIYQATRRFEKAGALFWKRLSTLERTAGPGHIEVAHTLYKMAPSFWNLGQFAKATKLLKRARAIYEKNLGLDHAFIADTLKRQASVYELIGLWEEAAPLLKEARAMRTRLAKRSKKNKAAKKG